MNSQLFRALVRPLACGFTVLACLCLAPALRAADEPLPSIFNGHDLTGWKVPATNLIWKIADGVLIGQSDEKKTGSMLYTTRSYSNFVFETEVRWSGDCDSGVMFRKPELQMQLGISRSLKVDMTCAFYTGGKDAYPMAGRPRNMEKLFKPDAWNRVRLQVIGATATVWLNGEQVSQYTDAKYAAPGPIGLQVHPGVQMKVEFRDVRLKELP